MSRSLEELERDNFLAEAESLAQLLQHPSWARYEALLTQMRSGALELMATARKQSTVLRCQGAAEILRELIERPHRIVATAKSVVEEETQRKQETRTALDFVGTVRMEDDL